MLDKQTKNKEIKEKETARQSSNQPTNQTSKKTSQFIKVTEELGKIL